MSYRVIISPTGVVMKLKDILEFAKDLPETALVKICYVGLDYFNKHPNEIADCYWFGSSDTGISFYYDHDCRSPLLIAELRKLDENISCEIDKEDGYVFEPVGFVTKHDGMLILHHK